MLLAQGATIDYDRLLKQAEVCEWLGPSSCAPRSVGYVPLDKGRAHHRSKEITHE